MSLEINLQGKRALVSGVSSGIGGGIAQILALAGCDIAGCGLDDSDSEGAQLFRKSVANEGRKAVYTSLDLTVPGTIENWVETAAAALGGIDIVISNAGGNIFRRLEKCTNEVWEANINLNLAAHWRLAKATYPYLQQNERGIIVVISSNHAFYTMPGCFPYNVAKAGLIALVQSLAIEWGPHTRAVGIAPGYVETPAQGDWLEKYPDAAAKLAKIKALHPVNRMGSVTEIGALCAFLASEWGGFITGTTILADGGRSALMQDDMSYG